MIRKILNAIKWIAIGYMLLVINSYLTFLILRSSGLLSSDKPFPTGTIAVFLLIAELSLYHYWKKRNK